jgi:lipase maturation factor 1
LTAPFDAISGVGSRGARSEFTLARWCFFRALALIHLFAFGSFLSQARGLVGERGILPLAPFLDLVERKIGAERWTELPMLFWITGGSDGAILTVGWLGIVFALLLMLGFFEHVCLVALWALYLSISIGGRTFFSFQWDILLLEVTISALFMAELRLFPRFLTRKPEDPTFKPGVALLWVLLFKLVFSSGVAKWRSGDETWRTFRALFYHYETQPLPTWIGWWAHQLPAGFQTFSVMVMFALQLAVPFFFFLGRPMRLAGAALTASLQVLIALTGNYCFFNLLALALCLLLVDDASFARLLPARWRTRVPEPDPTSPSRASQIAYWARAVSMVPFFVLNGLLMVRTVGGGEEISEAGEQLLYRVSSFRTVNSYGLFAVMTTSRKEIVVEGSDDGVVWKPYELRYKPGDLYRRPRFVAPHQPRLDWQMWFAALGSAPQNPWFTRFVGRLLEGSPEVLDLIAANPFPEKPPRWIRGELFDYHFTSFEERAATGAWWKRTYERPWFPPRALDGAPPSH